MKQYMLFDLDGTLTDPKEGITTCVQYALKSFGIEEPDLDKLEPFIGPPLKDSFMEFYNMTSEQADEAVAKYRERFSEKGMFENEVYGGIYDLLRSLQGNGMHLAVASSKPTVYVEKILKHFKLDKYFEVVVGSELDGTRVEKAQVIQEVLHRFFKDGKIAYDEVYMIGDRKFDILAARTFHIESVGVTYGYGSMEELKEAKADYIVQSVAELKKLLMREVNEKKRKEEENKAKEPGANKPKGGYGMLWKIFFPFIMFFLVRRIAANMVLMALQLLAVNVSVLDSAVLIRDEAGAITNLTGNAYVIGEMLSYMIAAAFIWKYAKSALTKTADEMRLAHLKKEPVQNYIFLGLTTLAAVIGLNLLIGLSGVMEASDTYQAVAQAQYSSNIFLGLLCYGLVTAVCEELLFRGVVYNCMRQFMKLPMAMVLSAFVFGAYHENSVQTFYAFVLGFLLAYGYEYFGNFSVPVAMHMGANIVAYCLTRSGLLHTGFASWPVCIACVAVAAVSFFMLTRQKKILK